MPGALSPSEQRDRKPQSDTGCGFGRRVSARVEPRAGAKIIAIGFFGIKGRTEQCQPGSQSLLDG
jgi:hypothetical protein